MNSKTSAKRPPLLKSSRRRILLVLISLIIAISTLCCIKYSNFYLVIILSAFFFLLFQFLAFSNIVYKETIFKCADYVYYGLIGGIVGVGSLYFLNNDLLELLNKDQAHEVTIALISEMEFNIGNLEQDISTQNVVLSNAENDLKDYMSGMPRFMLKRCFDPLLGLEQQKNDPNIIDGCEFPKLLELRVRDLDRVVDQLSNRRNNLTERLIVLKNKREKLLEQIDKIKSEIHNVDIAEVKISLIWIPTFLLIGFAIKIGKTTNSLCSTN